MSLPAALPSPGSPAPRPSLPGYPSVPPEVSQPCPPGCAAPALPPGSMPLAEPRSARGATWSGAGARLPLTATPPRAPRAGRLSGRPHPRRTERPPGAGGPGAAAGSAAGPERKCQGCGFQAGPQRCGPVPLCGCHGAGPGAAAGMDEEDTVGPGGGGGRTGGASSPGVRRLPAGGGGSGGCVPRLSPARLSPARPCPRRGRCGAESFVPAGDGRGAACVRRLPSARAWRERPVPSALAWGGAEKSFILRSLLLLSLDPCPGSTSAYSGSVDGSLYLREKPREKLRMTMPMTLSFCYMALLWLREPITLSDLLRFAVEGHIPYLNVFQHFPEKMKLCGLDLKIFCVESWPGYEEVHSKMLELAAFLKLPRFPDVTPSCFLHPDMLCMKYLMEANLPDALHSWTCLLVRKLGLGAAEVLTLVPAGEASSRVRHDLLAAALIVVVLKLLFLLDDHYEWLLSDFAEERNKNNKEGGTCFELKKWYRVVRSALDVEQQRLDEERAKCLWRCEKPLSYSAQRRSKVLKRREIVVSLQNQFGKLAGRVPPAEKPKPASFQFQWSEESPAGSCFHGHSLQAVVQDGCSPPRPLNPHYWLCTAKLCSQRLCGHLAHYRGVDFPQSYHFVLRLFSFLLRVEPSSLHQEVCLLEHKLFHKRLSKKPRSSTRLRR
ncbi:TATA box-binding protein-associated factor RNA polymerase I subunit B [Indicator indicator]|uniref:TATA box-binding protein-associated factor RNA polymerase I subunit B n=1 Tax=Indicator indicator TaxID=1002788 RepID=UPI0023DE7FB5|nr:TATA box-binding protein-associated factor RNA polymerase I subunit B [Indicator indicator]